MYRDKGDFVITVPPDFCPARSIILNQSRTIILITTCHRAVIDKITINPYNSGGQELAGCPFGKLSNPAMRLSNIRILELFSVHIRGLNEN